MKKLLTLKTVSQVIKQINFSLKPVTKKFLFLPLELMKIKYI